MRMRQSLVSILLAGLLLAGPAVAREIPGDGVEVGKASVVRNLVPAAALEQAAAQEYSQIKRNAAAKGALAPENVAKRKRATKKAGVTN